MTSSQFIPTGRTSLVERNGVAIQLQTEYAARPAPRVTTTILESGRVIHKIERNLPRAIESLEEQQKVEAAIRRQHAEVAAVVKDPSSSLDFINISVPTEEPTPALSLPERIKQIEGVERIYRLDLDGNFTNEETSAHFRKEFGPVFKNLSELLSIFMRLPGGAPAREYGLYEVQDQRLYLLSTGWEFYFVLVNPVARSVDYEPKIREVMALCRADFRTA